MKSDTKNILKLSLILILIIGVILSIYLIKNKYDKVEILSIKQEYNLVYSNTTDTINIPLYFKRDNSYLSRNSQIENVYLSNDDTLIKANLKSITTGITASYNDNQYYEFIFNLAFPSYDDFNEPIFIDDCNFNIEYKNGKTLSFEIGNINVLFNTNYTNEDYIKLNQLSAVTNEVNGILTVVGINLTLYNSSNSSIYLNSILVNNLNYELDNINYKLEKYDTKKVLSSDSTYSYIGSVSNKEMSLEVNSNSKIELFIPLKYKNEIMLVNNLPLYINYSINGNNLTYIQDDFTFFNKINPLSSYEVYSYVYSY